MGLRMCPGAQTLPQPVALLLGGRRSPLLFPWPFCRVALADCDGTCVAWERAASVHLVLQTRLPSFLCAASPPSSVPPPVRVRLVSGHSRFHVIPSCSHFKSRWCEPWRACACHSASAQAGQTPDLHEVHNPPASQDRREACLGLACARPACGWHRISACSPAGPHADGSRVLAPMCTAVCFSSVPFPCFIELKHKAFLSVLWRSSSM